MESDLGVKVNQDGNLDYLAKQGVLLLNTSLTVREHQANSHSNKGWEIFTEVSFLTVVVNDVKILVEIICS